MEHDRLNTVVLAIYIYIFINHEFEIRTTSQAIQQIKPYNSPAIRTRLHEENPCNSNVSPA